MTRALEELGKPVGHEALRARMAALHGREDPLLDEERFVQLLRQASDAEVAEVRKLDDDEYEIVLPKVGRARLAERVAAKTGAQADADATPPAEEVSADAERSADGTAAGRPALRFRRGSRGGATGPREISLVGVVSVDDGAGAKKTEAKAEAKASRSRAAGRAPAASQ
ncbi:MAG: hypothetical protein R2909_19280 [Gemmatimonadales bacterium]